MKNCGQKSSKQKGNGVRDMGLQRRENIGIGKNVGQIPWNILFTRF